MLFSVMLSAAAAPAVVQQPANACCCCDLNRAAFACTTKIAKSDCFCAAVVCPQGVPFIMDD